MYDRYDRKVVRKGQGPKDSGDARYKLAGSETVAQKCTAYSFCSVFGAPDREA